MPRHSRSSRRHLPKAGAQFVFAISLPPIFVLCVLVGAGQSVFFWTFAALLTIAGAICMAGAVRPGSRTLAGIIYTVVVGMILFALSW